MFMQSHSDILIYTRPLIPISSYNIYIYSNIHMFFYWFNIILSLWQVLYRYYVYEPKALLIGLKKHLLAYLLT